MTSLLGPTGRPGGPWVAAQPFWQLLMDSGARREHPGDITMEFTSSIPPRGRSRVLIYRHRGMRVRGLPGRFPVEVQFWENPYYATYGLSPLDYPRVFADFGAPSKHRMPDDGALCLWYPHDPVEMRWVHTDGLAMLLRLVADHLLCEAAWREDGADEVTSIWPSEEAPHGFVGEAPRRRGNRTMRRSADRRAS